jgi:hypothetical protein
MASVASLAFQPHCTFSDRVAHLLDRIDCRPAESAHEREAIFRLRYEAYLREGAIGPNFAETFADPYDETDNAWLFGLYIDGDLASSIRLHVASRAHRDFPSRKVFADLLDSELDAGRVIVDPTRFVTARRHSRLNPGLPHVTLRLAWLAAEHFGAEHFLVAVRAEHQAFYRRTFKHRPICEPRPYPLLAKPISLMTVHYPAVADQVHQRYPFFRSTFFERRMLFDRHLLVSRVAFRPDAVAAEVHHAA